MFLTATLAGCGGSDENKSAPAPAPAPAQIESLYQAYPAIVRGPDLWTFFKYNPGLISSDNLHPSADGNAGLRQQWANTMLQKIYP